MSQRKHGDKDRQQDIGTERNTEIKTVTTIHGVKEKHGDKDRGSKTLGQSQIQR